MALPWIRLDTQFASNPKILALLRQRDGHRTAFVWVCSLAYSGAHGTDGFIPKEALPFVHGRPHDADRLVDTGLWKPEPGGWSINGWHEYQASSDEAQRRRERAQAAARMRWDKVKAGERR